MKYIDFFQILHEGGAAGHMAHPFDVDSVRTGKDLINFFNKAYNVVKKGKSSLKIDGVNVSIKLVSIGKDKFEFALDRGSMKPLDVQGVTVAKLKDRFGEGHGMVLAGQKTLGIMNAAIPTILGELEQLGFTKDPTLFFNTEFVQGQTNVLSYDHDFLAIHGINKFTPVSPTKRVSVETSYNTDAFKNLINKVNEVASKHNFKVYGDVPVKSIGTPNYTSVLNQPFTVIVKGEKTSETLGKRLNVTTNPKGLQIKLNDGRTVHALSKEVYVALLNGTPVDQLTPNKPDQDKAIAGAVFYHATRVLGDALLSVATTDMGSAKNHEGLVLRDSSLAPYPVKVTGNFIVDGLQTKFSKRGAENEEEGEDQLSSPYTGLGNNYLAPTRGTSGGTGLYLTPKMSSFAEMVDAAIGDAGRDYIDVLVIYPGRFQPFHLGHAKVYNELSRKFPQSTVLIATSNKVDEKSPFGFEEKRKMILASGVDPAHVVMTANPYTAIEAVANRDKTRTIVIFAVGEKDMVGPEARFKFGLKKDGKPAYFQKYTSIGDCKPMSEHGYVLQAPTVNFTVSGKTIKSASEVREMYKNASEDQRKQIVTDLYGKFNSQIYNLFNQKIG